MGRPLVFVTCAITLGMALGVELGTKGLFAVAGLGLLSVVLLSLLKLWNRYFIWVLGLWFLLLGMAWFLVYQAPHSLLLDKLGSEVAITGEISQVSSANNSDLLIVRINQVDSQKVNSQEFCQVYVNTPKAEYKYGQLIAFSGKPELLPENGNPGAFSYREYQLKKGIYTQVKAASPPRVIGSGGNLLGKTAEWFHKKATQLSVGVMSPRESGVFLGILFGDTQALSPEDKEIFSTTGVLHAFAVSGSNVAFVLFFGLIIFSFLPERLRLCATALIVIFYAVLTGSQGPVVRATIMALLVLVGQFLGRRGDGLNSLALAALVMLLYNPGNISDAGFQLSFAATWGLIVLVPALTPQGASLPKQFKELLMFPIAAQIATLPLLAYYFNQISLIGIIANILITWFLAVILEVGLAAVSLGVVFEQLGALFLLPLNYLIRLTLWVLALLSKVPGAAFWVITPPKLAIGAYYLILLAWIYRDRWAASKAKLMARINKYLVANGARRLVIPAFLGGLLLLTTSIALPRQRTLEVEFLDVGQGDSALISTPSGKHYLVDGGPRSDKFDTGKSIILPYLFSREIKQLDGVFLSHPHDDHSGGLVQVVDALKIGSFFFPAADMGEEDLGWWNNIRQELTKNEIPLRKLSAGQSLQLDIGVYLKVLSPTTSYAGTHSDPNNNSLVFEVSYGKRSVLFTGDIELEALAELRNSVLLPNSVIKIPHHGSKYGLDREVFDRLTPPFVVISVGKNNFGQPAPEVNSYWAERNIPLLRTDQKGLIRLTTDGKDLKVYTGRDQQLFWQSR